MSTKLADYLAANPGTGPVEGAVAVLIAELPAAGGTATSGKQDTGNTSLASIDTKLGLTPTVQKDLSAVTIDTIATVWTPASGKKFKLMGGTISVSAAVSVLFEDNAAAATVFRTPKLAADTPYNFVVLGGQGFLSAAINNVLKATGSAAANITGTLYGTEV